MNTRLSGLGADRNRLAVLGTLLGGLALYYFWPSGTPAVSTPVAQPAPTGMLGPLPASRTAGRQAGRNGRFGPGNKSFRNSGEFKPSLKPPKDEVIDRSTIDPTLHLELLARLKTVKVEGGARSIFDFGAAPPPVPVQLAVKEPAKILTAKFVGPKQPPPPPPPAPPPPEPPPPPIPLKFYGFVNQSKAGVKRAFFLDGEDIILAAEGQLIKNRYKIVRIGVNSAVVEDTQFKNHQQTLPLVEEITG